MFLSLDTSTLTLSLALVVREGEDLRAVEHVVIGAGRALIGVAGEAAELSPDDYIRYPGDVPHVFSVLGRGGTAVINSQGGLSWQKKSTRPGDVYVHVADQKALNQRIERLLVLNDNGRR